MIIQAHHILLRSQQLHLHIVVEDFDMYYYKNLHLEGFRHHIVLIDQHGCFHIRLVYILENTFRLVHFLLLHHILHLHLVLHFHNQVFNHQMFHSYKSCYMCNHLNTLPILAHHMFLLFLSRYFHILDLLR